MTTTKTKQLRMYDGKDKLFLTACELAGITPTRRQRKKWEEKRGSAWSHRADAKRLHEERKKVKEEQNQQPEFE